MSVNSRTYKPEDRNAGLEKTVWIQGSAVLTEEGASVVQLLDGSGANLFIGEGVRIGRVSVRAQSAAGAISAGAALALTAGGAGVNTLIANAVLGATGTFTAASTTPIVGVNHYAVLNVAAAGTIGDIVIVDIETIA